MDKLTNVSRGLIGILLLYFAGYSRNLIISILTGGIGTLFLGEIIEEIYEKRKEI